MALGSRVRERRLFLSAGRVTVPMTGVELNYHHLTTRHARLIIFSKPT
jgi:hypothetical protein